MGTRGRILAAAAVTVLLAGGSLVAMTLTASASPSASCNTQEVNESTQASCSTEADIYNAASIEYQVTAAPAGVQVKVSWSGACDGYSINNGIFQGAEPLTRAIGLPEQNPYYCIVDVSATVVNGGENTSIGLLVEYTPQASSSPTPSPSTSSYVPPTGNAVRGFDGECLDAAGNGSTARSKIQLWNCQVGPAQQWVYEYGELFNGSQLCVNVKGKPKAGAKLITWQCDNAANETWRHNAAGEYVLKYGGYKLCLTDPGHATGNGIQLIVAACDKASDQRWTLP
jgi:hypothetical protein